MAKKKNSKKTSPKPGDTNYLTPTQLRNRRKRKAKQEQQEMPSNVGYTHNKQSSSSSSSSSLTNKNKNLDPSMKYIANPMKAPIVQTAKKYFQPILLQEDCNNTSSSTTSSDFFHVHLGPLYQWRTVSKLAVRPSAASSLAASLDNKKAVVAIGLFLPQSHTLLPVPKCRAHHPSINQAVEVITKACRDVGVVPYQEKTSGDYDNNDNDGSSYAGSGQLRYVAINVERGTGAVQATLVWNTPPPPSSSAKKQEEGSKKRERDEDTDDDILEKLITKIISMSTYSSGDGNSGSMSISEDKESVQSTIRTDDNDKSTDNDNDQSLAKKRRRRGRREGGKSEKNDTQTTNNMNINASNNSCTNKRGTPEPKKLKLHSIWVNYNQSWKHSNAIFAYDSSCWRHVHGPTAIVEHLSFENKQLQHAELLAKPKSPNFSIPLHFPPNVFRQANLCAFQNIVARIRERVQRFAEHDQQGNSNINCIELYGGVGTIGLHVSDVVSSLVSSDENPNNAQCFDDSVRALPIEIQGRLRYIRKNAADMISTETELFRNSHVLIVDPPRKGLDNEVVDHLCSRSNGDSNKAIKLVVYVSCGFQAFQRDCDALIKSGRWKVEFAEGYLLFPGSDAIETLAFFVPK